jgi:dolichol kinase
MTAKPLDEGRGVAEKDIGRMVTMVLVGLAALLIIWPSVKEFVTPIWRNFEEVTALKRTTEDNRARIDKLEQHNDKFFPRKPLQ